MMNIVVPGLKKRLHINTIFCIGRNYLEHARELNNPVPKNPVIFIKPITSIIYSDDTIILPPESHEVHFETEIVVAIGEGGKNIPAEEALSHVDGYGIGIDVTARDLQQQAKEKSLPWAIAKGFDTFAPISNFVEAVQVPDISNLAFNLRINGETRQEGNTCDMIFSIPALISRLSNYFTLNPGDLIFTGTPQGVGPLYSGDVLEASLGDNLTSLHINVE